MALSDVSLIVGIENCGSTLLLDMLKTNEIIFADFEVGLLNAVALDRESLNTWCNTYFHFAMLANKYGITREEILQLSECHSWYAAYAKLYESMIKNTGPTKRTHLIDKTPNYTLSLDRITKGIAGIKIIGIIRDPRAVYASWMKRPGRRQSPDKFMYAYNKSMHNLIRSANASPNTHIIRFEHLVLHPVAVLPLVCAHIGIEYSSAMCNPCNSYNQHDKTINRYGTSDKLAVQRDTTNGIDFSSIYEYHDLLSKQQQNEIIKNLDIQLHWLLWDVK